MSNAMSMKAKIRNIAKNNNIPAQVILQNYMFERFLVRLSKSEYKNKFILKGGMLVAAIIGIDNRATMDLDTTVKNLPLIPKIIEKAIQEICDINENDDVNFSYKAISPIREDDLYGGYRVMINAKYDTILTSLSIDISTGDVITPKPVTFTFHELFDHNKSFNLLAYNIETVMAEKIETILRRTVFNTRPRDFYDAYTLATTQEFDKKLFLEALTATALHSGTLEQIKDTAGIIENLSQSKELHEMWEKYRKQFAYAKDIEYNDIILEISKLLQNTKIYGG